MPPVPCLQNPRRAPRVSVRLRVEVSQRGDAWRAETVDIGPAGCRVATPRPLVARAPVWLTVRSDLLSEPLAVSGNVAWCEPARSGVAFVSRRTGASGDPEAWFKKLVRALPQLAAEVERSPDRVALDAALFVRPPPPELPHLSGDEIALLRRAENGLRVQVLIARSEIPADRASRALFGLLAKRILTLAHGEASEAWRWRALLARGAARPAAAASGASTPLPAILRAPPLPAATPAPRAPPTLARATPLPGAHPPPLPLPTPTLTLTPVPPPASRGPASSPPSRTPAAQLLIDQARAAAREGHIHDQALPLLRRALALSPRDAEIAELLGALAFKDRKVV
jgi:hypothetical protein